MTRTTSLALAATVAALALAAVFLTTRPEAPAGSGAPLVAVTLPAALPPEAEAGAALFAANCAACHGDNAAGAEGYGPPLVHRIYEPSHHGDAAFQVAVAAGVRAHHWRFGDMPPVQGVSPDEVTRIVAYIRALQRANGIE